MRFDKNLISTEVKKLMETLVQQGHIDVNLQKRPKLCESIESLLSKYNQQFTELEEKAQSFLISNQLDEERYFRRVLRNLAKEEELPTFSDSYDYLNEKIQTLLWNSDEVEEIFAEPRELVASITPYLKAMAWKQR